MAARRKPLTFSEAVATGDYRVSLEALRDRLASEIEAGVACKECGGTISSPTAPLAKQLADVLALLKAIVVPKESTVDDLARKRTQRRSGADAPVAPRRRGVQRGTGGGRARS